MIISLLIHNLQDSLCFIESTEIFSLLFQYIIINQNLFWCASKTGPKYHLHLLSRYIGKRKLSDLSGRYEMNEEDF
jgi:hypothetical protein